jgi:predicted DsbA family dithiol-disulfide isomerase
MAFKIAMFSDFICPFCYIGFEVVRQLKPEFDFELQWRGFQIHPDWPAEGIAPERALPGAEAEARKGSWQRISEMATSVGLAMKPPSVFTNSRAALLIAEHASAAGCADAFEERVYRAYFQERANIGDREVIVALAGEVGIDREAAAAALKSPKYEMRLKNNALSANQRGVDGVPTFFIGEYALRGAQSLDTMRKVLKRANEVFGNGQS